MSTQVRGRYRATEIMHGTAGLAGWIGDRCRHTTTLIVDANVADAPITTRIRQTIEWAGKQTDLVVLSGPGDLPSITELAARLADAETAVAIGGGSLLDQAKLATLLSADPTLRTRLTLRNRSGVVLLPPTSGPALPLAAVPTTVGTGSEVSAASCLASTHGKRLIVGNGLQPELAVLDPLATQTLPAELLAEGALEILFRMAGMYAGDHTDLPTEDAFVEALLRRLIRVGNELADLRRDGGRTDGRLRLEIAKLSGLSHSPWMGKSRDPYACKGWYLANELSTRLGLRKMTAAAALLPALWQTITAPDPRWGSAGRLDNLWQAMTAAEIGRFPRDPVAGITALIDAWQVERHITATADEITETTGATLHAWGDGLPALAGLTRTDVHDLLTRALSHPVMALCTKA